MVHLNCNVHDFENKLDNVTHKVHLVETKNKFEVGKKS